MSDGNGRAAGRGERQTPEVHRFFFSLSPVSRPPDSWLSTDPCACGGGLSYRFRRAVGCAGEASSAWSGARSTPTRAATSTSVLTICLSCSTLRSLLPTPHAPLRCDLLRAPMPTDELYVPHPIEVHFELRASPPYSPLALHWVLIWARCHLPPPKPNQINELTK